MSFYFLKKYLIMRLTIDSTSYSPFSHEIGLLPARTTMLSPSCFTMHKAWPIEVHVHSSQLQLSHKFLLKEESLEHVLPVFFLPDIANESSILAKKSFRLLSLMPHYRISCSDFPSQPDRLNATHHPPTATATIPCRRRSEQNNPRMQTSLSLIQTHCMTSSTSPPPPTYFPDRPLSKPPLAP